MSDNLIVMSDSALAEKLVQMWNEYEEMNNNGDYVEANLMLQEDIADVRAEIVARWMYEQGHKI